MSTPYRLPSSPSVAPLRHGLFKEMKWCCNCPGRPQAVRRQTKKEGPNKGRWFWTCDQPQHVRCSFFLWESDATMREQATVRADSQSEIDPLNITPSKPRIQTSNNGMLTPQTERRFYDTPARNFKSPPKSAKARMISEASDEYDWNDDSDDNDALLNALSSTQATETFVSQANYNPESPSKTPRTTRVTSPGKRKLFDSTSDISPRGSEIATPFSAASSRTATFPSSAELCLTPTPSKYSDVLSADSRFDTSELAKSLLELMEKHEVVLPNKARKDVVSLLNRHDLKTQGIIRGRDMTRLALKKKDTEISNLKERVANLEAQRELDRTVFDGMK